MMNNSPSKPIDFILILRGLLACAVVIFHTHGFATGRIGNELYTHIIPWWLVPSGELGVWCFFVLSGYLMGKGFYNKRYIFSKDSILKFYANRAIRILPLYGIVVGFSLLLFGFYLNPTLVQQHWVKLLTELSFFQYSYFDTLMGFNAPLWSIATEVQFYCWVPLWFQGLQFLTKKINSWLVLIGLLALGTGLRLGIYYQEILPHCQPTTLPLFFQTWALKLYTPLLTNVYLFAGGMLLNWLIPQCKQWLKQSATRLSIISGLPIIAFCISSYLLPFSFSQFKLWAFKSYIIYIPMLAFCWVLPFIIWQEQRIMAPTFLKPLTTVLERLGQWSYGIYLWHYPIVWLVVQKWISPDAHLFQHNLATYWACIVLVGLCISIGLSALTFYLIEHPLEVRKHKTMPLA